MPNIRGHKVWVATYTVELERREQLSHDESRATGEWVTMEDTIHVVAPDDEGMFLAWFAKHFKFSGGRDRKITALSSYSLTAFIQEHQY